MRHLLTYIGVVFWAAAAQGSEPADPKVAEALAKATARMRAIATEGGYLWRHSEDRHRVFQAEKEAEAAA